MPAAEPSTVEKTLRWYLGRTDVKIDAARLGEGIPIALIGGLRDDLEGFADRLAPDRPVLDITEDMPSAHEVHRIFDANPDAIVLARTGEVVFTALGVIAQPWRMLVSPLAARPHDAMRLLREAIVQLGVLKSLDALGPDLVASLAAYNWPRGLVEVRVAARRFGALLNGGSYSAAGRDLAISRQALAKFINRRTSN